MISIERPPQHYRGGTAFVNGAPTATRADWAALWNAFEIPGPYMRGLNYNPEYNIRIIFRAPIPKGPEFICRPFEINSLLSINGDGWVMDFESGFMNRDGSNTPLRESWKQFSVNVLGSDCWLSNYLISKIKEYKRVWTEPAASLWVERTGRIVMIIPYTAEIGKQLPPYFQQLKQPKAPEIHTTPALPMPDMIQLPQIPVRIGTPWQSPYIGDQIVPGNPWVDSNGVVYFNQSTGTADIQLHALISSIDSKHI
jgi:hypothetical protein